MSFKDLMPMMLLDNNFVSMCTQTAGNRIEARQTGWNLKLSDSIWHFWVILQSVNRLGGGLWACRLRLKQILSRRVGGLLKKNRHLLFGKGRASYHPVIKKLVT